MKYVGYPYRFGGTTPRGFDSSGFVYCVVDHAGHSVSRDMYAQLASGTRVSSSKLQPGDLLFFSNTYKGGIFARRYLHRQRQVRACREPKHRCRRQRSVERLLGVPLYWQQFACP